MKALTKSFSTNQIVFEKFQILQKLLWKNQNPKTLPLFGKLHSFVTMLLLVIAKINYLLVITRVITV